MTSKQEIDKRKKNQEMGKEEEKEKEIVTLSDP